jgi:hypothetical protein
MSALVLATPAQAHGQHDALLIARDLAAGPYVISLWQISTDAGTSVTPHVIVMFDEAAAAAPADGVVVSVNGTPVDTYRSMATANAWETVQGVAEGDRVGVSISAGDQHWTFGPAAVPPPQSTGLPMKEIVIGSFLLTLRVASWGAARAIRRWRQPMASADLATVHPG